MSPVVCPPYDVISPQDQDHYYGMHDANAVRLVLGKTCPQDDEEANRYTRAEASFRDWLSRGILSRDPSPSYYLLGERFRDGQGEEVLRHGILGAARLENFHPESSIRPHEATHAGPKKDRLALMKTTQANFSPIFALYQDLSLRVENLFGREEVRFLFKADGRDGVERRVYALSDPALQQEIATFLGDKVLLIADGHHRYETALAYRDWRREREEGTKTGPRPYDYALMYLANIESPGTRVYPTHRILKDLGKLDVKRFLETAKAFFDVHEIGDWRDSDYRGRLFQAMGDRSLGDIRIGCCFQDVANAMVLALPDPDRVSHLFSPEVTAGVRRLEVSILHDVLIGQGLGISREVQGREDHVKYVKEASAALEEMARDADLSAAFLLNAPPVREIMEVALSGIRLPQKTTYFYPKLLTGLVFRLMDDDQG